MKSQSVTKYESPLRADQARATRERILAAVRLLLEQDPGHGLGFDEIAAASGVNRRTIFRYFPTKDALLAEFWKSVNASLGVRFWPRYERDLVDLPPNLFASLDGIEGIVRASHASGAGREMRLQANGERQAAFRESLADVLAGMPPAKARQFEAVIQLLFSATAWLTMKDYWDLTGRESGEGVSWAIDALLKAAKDQKGAVAERK